MTNEEEFHDRENRARNMLDNAINQIEISTNRYDSRRDDAEATIRQILSKNHGLSLSEVWKYQSRVEDARVSSQLNSKPLTH